MRFNILPFFSSKYFPFASVSLVIVLFYLIKLLIGFLVYKDCKKSKMGSELLWALIVILVPNFFGLIVYFIVKFSYKPKSQQVNERCQNCGSLIQKDWTVCPYCNSKILKDNIINESRNNNNNNRSSNYSNENYNSSKYSTNYNKTSNYNNEGFYEEKNNSNILKIIVIIIIIITLIGGIVVANLFSVHRITELFPNGNISMSSTSSESSHSIKKSYSYWNGNEEKAVKIKESGNMTLVYNLVCEKGSLYAVLKDDNNKLIYTFSQNGEGIFEKHVNKGETYFLTINGNETKGKFSFNWDID